MRLSGDGDGAGCNPGAVVVSWVSLWISASLSKEVSASVSASNSSLPVNSASNLVAEDSASATEVSATSTAAESVAESVIEVAGEAVRNEVIIAPRLFSPIAAADDDSRKFVNAAKRPVLVIPSHVPGGVSQYWFLIQEQRILVSTISPGGRWDMGSQDMGERGEGSGGMGVGIWEKR